jgi:nitrate reductase NapE component
MISFEILSLLWIVISVAAVAGFAYFIVWRDERKLRRHPAE